MFQGGFVGIECDILLTEDFGQESGRLVHTIFPEDVNDLQTFALPESISVLSTDKLQLKFRQSSDFYGRVTVYIIHFNGHLKE